MAQTSVTCPHCQSNEAIVKYGKSAEGKQRFCCRSQACHGRTFILDVSYPGRIAAVKQQIIEMTLSGKSVREVARELHVSTRTVIAELKKNRGAQNLP